MVISMKPIYIEMPAVCNAVSLGETTVQRMIREGTFPAPRQLSGRRVGWLVSEIEEWAENRPVSTLLCPANTGRRKSKPAEEAA